jgi:hypothetical protein
MRDENNPSRFCRRLFFPNNVLKNNIGKPLVPSTAEPGFVESENESRISIKKCLHGSSRALSCGCSGERMPAWGSNLTEKFSLNVTFLETKEQRSRQQ